MSAAGLVAKRKLSGSETVARGSLDLVGGSRVTGMSAALEMPEAGGRDRSQRKQWEKVFEACDEDKKGYLSREDYKVAVVMLFGYKPSKAEVNSVMASVKQNQSGISLEEFHKFMSRKKSDHFYHNEVRQLFTAFDRQCKFLVQSPYCIFFLSCSPPFYSKKVKGFLSLEDLKKAFNIVAPKLPERTIVEVFREVDQDSDGHISYKDFELAMNYGQENLSAISLKYVFP
nr:PREDICTED: EF-hand calcium-binding domain-containing protein 11 [Anolis carolinensis]|eukprot:XP_016846908.1 PREDICTED: EF-hand calcium-binding domain-containing protein 11 [Anolis carolinensis]